jgi:hypothetical protein
VWAARFSRGRPHQRGTVSRISSRPSSPVRAAHPSFRIRPSPLRVPSPTSGVTALTVRPVREFSPAPRRALRRATRSLREPGLTREGRAREFLVAVLTCEGSASEIPYPVLTCEDAFLKIRCNRLDGEAGRKSPSSRPPDGSASEPGLSTIALRQRDPSAGYLSGLKSDICIASPRRRESVLVD